ncbi:MAG: hypothetical protein ACI9EF_000831 [Pseudohongiellaceae bacterium]|jgi:hypothetical protein
MRTAFLAMALVTTLACVSDCTSQQITIPVPSRPKINTGGCLTLGEQKVTDPQGAAGDIYGAALAIEGDMALVASEWDDDKGFNSGAVFVFRCMGDSWKSVQKLVPSDGQAGDNFGRAVSLSGDTALIGTHWDDDNGFRSGSAYIYKYDGSQWIQDQKLLAADGKTNDRFGNSVFVQDDVLAVCAWLEDQGASAAGAVYIFRNNGTSWIQEQKLQASDKQAGDNFGRYVYIDGDALIVGAYHEDEGGADAGAAYIFRHNGGEWVEEQKLMAWDAAANDYFGWSCAILGDVAVVGSFQDDDMGSNSGSAYVYRFNGTSWLPEQKLLASNGVANDRLGYAVVMDRNHILLTAPASLTLGAGPGSMYLYRETSAGWIEQQIFAPSDGAAQDAFGFHADLSGHVTLTGSWRDDDAGADTGSAYFYGFNEL